MTVILGTIGNAKFTERDTAKKEIGYSARRF